MKEASIRWQVQACSPFYETWHISLFDCNSSRTFLCLINTHTISHLCKLSWTHLLSRPTITYSLRWIAKQHDREWNLVPAWGKPGQKQYFKMQVLTVEWEVQGFEHLWGCSFHKHRCPCSEYLLLSLVVMCRCGLSLSLHLVLFTGTLQML